MKTHDRIAARSWVSHVDDERGDGGSILVTLKLEYVFDDERDCGVRGFDTLTEAEMGTRKDAVFKSAA
jgi:hypothetical protein